MCVYVCVHVYSDRINHVHTRNEALRHDWPPRFLIYDPELRPQPLILVDIFGAGKSPDLYNTLKRDRIGEKSYGDQCPNSNPSSVRNFVVREIR